MAPRSCLCKVSSRQQRGGFPVIYRKWKSPTRTTTTHCIVLYCIVSINLYSASCSAHQSEALPVRETQREERPIVSAGLVKERQWYLYKNIRQYVLEPWQDVMCPLPKEQ